MTMSNTHVDAQWTLFELEALLLDAQAQVTFDPYQGQVSLVQAPAAPAPAAPQLASVVMMAPSHGRPQRVGVPRDLGRPSLEAQVDALLHSELALTLAPAVQAPQPQPAPCWGEVFELAWTLPAQDEAESWALGMDVDWDALPDPDEEVCQLDEEDLSWMRAVKVTKERRVRQLINRLDAEVSLSRAEYTTLERMLSWSGNPRTTLKRVAELMLDGWSLDQLEATHGALRLWNEHHGSTQGLTWMHLLRLGDCLSGVADAEELYRTLLHMHEHWQGLRDRIYCGSVDVVTHESEWLDVPQRYFCHFLRFHLALDAREQGWLEELVAADLDALPRPGRWGDERERAMCRRELRAERFFAPRHE